MLVQNVIDIAASPVLLSGASLDGMNFAQSYFKESNVLVVLKGRRDEFSNLGDLKNNPNFIIGNLGYFSLISKRYFHYARSVEIQDFMHISHALDEGIIDAMYWGKSQAIAYCTKNPEYVVIDYGESIGHSYLAFPVKFDAFAFIFFLNSWIKQLEGEGFNKKQYDYWMLGHPPDTKKNRWSLLKEISRKRNSSL